ncbi:hypothetical protein B0H14DRAFT_3484891 [Mycena olivaceomarginata]|nr:hypothetical protein B0H14DRAFT_3484891 [Mycena olivaceomarginata]
MCNLRGIVMLKLHRADQAKQWFMEALELDVKCFDAFEQLASGEMMTPDGDAGERVALTRQRFVEEYLLGYNPDVLFSFSDTLYAGFWWADCFAITTRILGLVSIHNPTMPLHSAVSVTQPFS